jgi:hypothetical protein
MGELEEFGLSYSDVIGQHKKPTISSQILALSSDWQITRDTLSFCGSCAELVSNRLIKKK